MTKIAVWCRHVDDNVIGIGSEIPWRVASDFKRFRRITEGQCLVAGQKTYESFPNRTLPNRKIIVLTFNHNYEVADKKNHSVVVDIKQLMGLEDDLYIAGGASVYKAFMTGEKELMPEIIVDSMCLGELNPALKGEKIDITPCIDVMKQKYTKISQDYELDNVVTSVYVKKGEFVEQTVLKQILQAIEAED